MYLQIYENLCSNNRVFGEHKHHIVPKHMGGNDDKSNLVYLTVREHIIAHFLLWKIHRTPNDLRAIKMLGVKLTPEQRHITGKWCHENKIGFHAWTTEQHRMKNKGRKASEETKKKMSEKRKGRRPYEMTDEIRANISKAKKGSLHTEESKAKMSATRKRQKWWNNGVEQRRLEECPEGWVRGRLQNGKQGLFTRKD